MFQYLKALECTMHMERSLLCTKERQKWQKHNNNIQYVQVHGHRSNDSWQQGASVSYTGSQVIAAQLHV